MNQRKQQVGWLLAVTLLGVAGYACYRGQARQAAALARIVALDNQLTANNQSGIKAMHNTVLSIEEAVSKNHNPAADVAVLRQAQAIERRTRSVLDTLHRLRQQWRAGTAHVAIAQLTRQVDEYITYIHAFVPDAVLLTQPTRQAAVTGWLGEFYLAAEPTPAALAQLTKLEAQVGQVAAGALAQQAQKVGYNCGFTKIGAFAVPTSETVAPGALYEAQLMLMKAASSLRPTMSADERTLPLDPAGQGLVRRRVPRLRPGQPDTVRAQWHGLVRLRGRTADTVLAVTVPYFIVKSARL